MPRPPERAVDYAKLEPCRDFLRAADASWYVDAPGDWWVFITDVADSTRAIEAGRYRAVNTVGVGSIVCARRALDSATFPFTFGGDGATMLIPSAACARVAAALEGLRTLARDNFDLTLRVGAARVQDLRDAGHDLRLARHEVAPGQSIALLRGSGFRAADAHMRDRPEAVAEAGAARAEVDLAGMSCRWQPVPSRYGSILSLIVRARADDGEFYRRMLEGIDGILAHGIDGANPVDGRRMRYRGVAECVRDEVRYHRRFSRACAARMAEIPLAVAIFRHGLPGMSFDARGYTRALRTHSDFRKFDNSICMTLDCTPEEVRAIRVLCDDAHRGGDAWYGMCEADGALMTCFLDGLRDGEHLHFVDGMHGGYTEAARRLKLQAGTRGLAEN